MKVLIAPNAFKGSLPAPAAADAMAAGVRDAVPEARISLRPMADGGDGSAEVMAALTGGSMSPALPVSGRRARYALLPNGTAVVDMAAAAGLGGRRPRPEAALAASSRGAGELVAAAVRAGASDVVVALGGSASTDGGAGLLRALGAQTRARDGRPLDEGGGALAAVAAVDLEGLRWLDGVRFTALVDVDNPLLGPRGAAAVFAPQKGADAAGVAALEAGLSAWADALEAAAGREARDRAGAGAAGGTGFGLAAALAATLAPGAPYVARACGLHAAIAECDLALTGEGRLDAQSVRGKAPAEVARMAAAAGLPCCVLAGDLGPGWEALTQPPFGAAVLALPPGPRGRGASLAATAGDLRRTAAMAVRLFAAGRIAAGGAP